MADSDKEEIFHDDENKKSPEHKRRKKKPLQLETQDHDLLSILHVDVEQYLAEIDKYFRMYLYGYLRKKAQAKLGFTHNDIEDLVQTTLMRFCIWIQNQQKASKTIELNHKAYLLTIARNVFFDEMKNRTSHNVLSLDMPINNQDQSTHETFIDLLPDPHGLDEQEGKFFLDKVRDTIERLREPYRTIMYHIAVDDMSETEVIDHLKVNPNTGKSWVRRGRMMLKEVLPDYKGYL